MNIRWKEIFIIGAIVLGTVSLPYASELNRAAGQISDVSETTSVRGIVTGAADNYIYIRNEEGRQIIVQTKPETKMEGSVKKGDWIEAQLLPNDHATSIKKVKSPEKH